MFAEQAVEVLLPGTPTNVVLAAGVSSAAIDLGALIGLSASDPMPSGGFHIYVACTAAFYVKSGATDPGAGVVTDFPLNANTTLRFKVTPQNRIARFFSTPGGTLSYCVASR